MNINQVYQHLENEGIAVSRDALEACLRPDVLDLLGASFFAVGADEGTLWLLDQEQKRLVPVWNSGISARQFVGRYWQPLDSGLISLVCVAEQGLCENAVYKNGSQNRALDRHLAKFTCAMIAVPLRFSGATAGVVSCVRLKDFASLPDPPPFSSEDLATIDRAVHNVRRQIDQFSGFLIRRNPLPVEPD